MEEGTGRAGSFLPFHLILFAFEFTELAAFTPARQAPEHSAPAPAQVWGLPGSQVGPACVVEFVEPSLPALCPHPTLCEPEPSVERGGYGLCAVL